MLQPYTFTVEHNKGRDNANADALSHLDYTLHYMPKKEGGDVMDGGEDGVNCAGREHDSAAEVSIGDTALNRTSQHYASEVPELNRTNQHYTSEVAGLDHSRRCEQGLTNERLPQEGSRQSWEETIK